MTSMKKIAVIFALAFMLTGAMVIATVLAHTNMASADSEYQSPL